MQPCKRGYVTTQICSYATMFQMFWEFSTDLERSNFSSEHPSNHVLSFLSNVPKQKVPLIIIK